MTRPPIAVVVSTVYPTGAAYQQVYIWCDGDKYLDIACLELTYLQTSPYYPHPQQGFTNPTNVNPNVLGGDSPPPYPPPPPAYTETAPEDHYYNPSGNERLVQDDDGKPT